MLKRIKTGKNRPNTLFHFLLDGKFMLEIQSNFICNRQRSIVNKSTKNKSHECFQWALFFNWSQINITIATPVLLAGVWNIFFLSFFHKFYSLIRYITCNKPLQERKGKKGCCVRVLQKEGYRKDFLKQLIRPTDVEQKIITSRPKIRHRYAKFWV